LPPPGNGCGPRALSAADRGFSAPHRATAPSSEPPVATSPPTAARTVSFVTPTVQPPRSIRHQPTGGKRRYPDHPKRDGRHPEPCPLDGLPRPGRTRSTQIPPTDGRDDQPTERWPRRPTPPTS